MTTPKRSGGRDANCPPPADARASKPKRILLWSCWAFMFSIPLESMDIGIEKTVVSISKITGYVFFLSTLLDLGACYRRVPAVVFFFSAYAFELLLHSVFLEYKYITEFIPYYLTLVQLLLLLWALSNLMRDDRFSRNALTAIALSCALLTALQFAGKAGQVYAPNSKELDEQRITAFDQNPNNLADDLSVGLIATIGCGFGRGGLSPASLLVWPMLYLIGSQIVLSGSRGGMMALAAGLLTLLLEGGGVQKRLKNVLIVGSAMGFLLWFVTHSEQVMTRWTLALSEGNLASREDIFPRAWGMFLERPLAGWGPVKHYYELGHRCGTETRDTHNLVLWVLTQVGLLGFIPYGLGVWSCLGAAWRARRGPRGALPMALMATVLVSNMSGTRDNGKLHWFALAFAVASAGRPANGGAGTAATRAGISRSGASPSGQAESPHRVGVDPSRLRRSGALKKGNRFDSDGSQRLTSLIERRKVF